MGLNSIDRRDVPAYRLVPPTEEEIALAGVADTQLPDDTDWAALYPEGESETRGDQSPASTDLT
jgi:hypothetical protein